jgi:hypothetical protein
MLSGRLHEQEHLPDSRSLAGFDAVEVHSGARGVTARLRSDGVLGGRNWIIVA